MAHQLNCFKAYDVRGELGEQLNEDIAYRIGRAYGEFFKPERVVLGEDARASSNALKMALAEGLMDSGADVLDLGVTGSEETYFAAFYLRVGGAIQVTASHNPINYNGMKFVQSGARPITYSNGLGEIKKLAEQQPWKGQAQTRDRGKLESVSLIKELVDFYLSFINCDQLKPLKVLVNAGNGTAGHVIDEIEKRFDELAVPVEFIKLFHNPDPTFPNGIPNPLLKENRSVTAQAVVKNKADFGVAWDGDFDRCFFFDEHGNFIESYYIVGLLAEAFLLKEPGASVVHDPRLTWHTVDVVNRLGGRPIQSKTGHVVVKECMREVDAIYGGEMSGHHYFKDFAYCDSGMIPWLLIAELISKKSTSLHQLTKEAALKYPVSGELNFKVVSPKDVVAKIKELYTPLGIKVETIDGLSVEFSTWRFNLRESNTESLLRLNIETKTDTRLLKEKTSELVKLIKAIG